MSRLLLKFEMMMLRKNDKQTTVKQIRQSKEQLDYRERERRLNIRYFHHHLSRAGDQAQGDSGSGYQDPGGRRSIAITISAELIITSGAQSLQPASIRRKLSRQKTPGKNSPGRVKVNRIGKVEIWEIFLTASGDQCCVIACAGLGRCRPTL